MRLAQGKRDLCGPQGLLSYTGAGKMPSLTHPLPSVPTPTKNTIFLSSSEFRKFLGGLPTPLPSPKWDWVGWRRDMGNLHFYQALQVSPCSLL